VKRIVVTSSCVAILSALSEPTVFSEDDWNVTSPKEVEEQGSNAAPMSIYFASKTLAEKAAWKFYENHKNEVQWDLAVINPPYVFGPPIHDVTSLKSLNTSLQTWYDMVVSDSPKSKEVLSESFAWVDVRDAALGHVLALENPDAGGQRIITTSGPYIWQEWLDAANSLSPPPLPSHQLPKGFPEILQGEKIYHISYDKSKEQRILKIKFRTQVDTTKDTLEDFSRRGW